MVCEEVENETETATQIEEKIVETIKMTLAWMPGGNRIGDDGKPSYKNAVKVDDKWFKFEPIFVWYKP